MKKNLGKLDRTIRIVVGLAIIAYGVLNQSLLGAIGIIPIATALISWCPLYCPLNLDTTCKNSSCKS